MKQLVVRPIGRFVILASLVFSQFVFADAPLKDDGGQGTIPMGPHSCISFDMSLSISDISVDIVGTDLMINFNSPVGIATVSINDSNGNLVYQTTVDTENTADLSLPTTLFGTGTYNVVVSYGSSVYTEQVQF